MNVRPKLKPNFSWVPRGLFEYALCDHHGEEFGRVDPGLRTISSKILTLTHTKLDEPYEILARSFEALME